MAYYLLCSVMLTAVIVSQNGFIQAQEIDCDTLEPRGLTAKPQSVPPPFTITVSKNQYLQGETLNVTINSTASIPFHGFLIQGSKAGSPNQDQVTGYFAIRRGEKSACRSYAGNAIRHKDGPGGYDEAKTSVQVTWTAPTPSKGHIRFRVTVIYSDEIFWVDEESAVIRDPNDKSELNPKADKDAFSMSPIDVTECGKTKGCYRNPEGCNQETCDMMVTWKDKGKYVDFEIAGDSEGWVAVGFSKDKKMGDDDVVDCVWDEEESKVRVQQSRNEEDDKKNVVLAEPQITLQSSEGVMSQGRIRCAFRRDKSVVEKASMYKLFDLTTEYHILMTRGDVDENGKKLIHVLEPNKYPYVSVSKVSVTQNVDITSTARYPLVKAHGIFMVIAWMLCCSTALIMAKYYKPMWPNDRLCKERVWFAVHRGCMITVLFLCILAIIFIFVHVGTWSWMPYLPEKAHPPLGITVFVLVILNPLIALCRCSPKSRYRPIFNWIHWFLGTCAAVLATPTLFIGLNLPKAHVPWWSTWVVVFFMLFHLIIELMLEIHGCINGRKQKLRDEEFELRKKNDPRGELYGKEPEPVGRRFKKRIIAIYLIVAIICTIIMVIAIAVG